MLAEREGLVAEAIRHMACELREYDAQRKEGTVEVLERTVRYLFNHLGRWPTAREAADAAGLTVEEVVDARLRGRPASPSSADVAVGAATPAL